MGLRNISEHLDEILSRVLVDLIAKQILVKTADDLLIRANTIMDELFSNYIDVLQCLQENNLCLAVNKTTISRKSLNILGLVWKKGTLQSDPHKIKPSKLVNNQKQLWS